MNCTVDKCDRPVSIKKWMLCNIHYQKHRRAKFAKCSGPDCTKMAEYKNGLCGSHNNQRLKGQELVSFMALRKFLPNDQGSYQCAKCSEWYPPEKFYQRKGKPTGYCIDCHAIDQAIRTYGITIEQYKRMVAEQGEACAICKRVPRDGRRLNVDHDHSCCSGNKSCGKCVRSLLCGSCNKMLGLVQDNVDILLSGVEYIKNTQSRV